MTAADAIRAVYPRHPMKRLALLLGVPVDTARHWLYRRFSDDHRRDLARALLAEFDRQEPGRRTVRRVLVEWAAGD